MIPHFIPPDVTGGKEVSAKIHPSLITDETDLSLLTGQSGAT
jgi:hypothetical protein